ncbi:MAG: universal stress protein [Gemmatimonadetes bacterium]|nr:universal stress protein [Gemmatimonadota bacterium]
MKDSRAKCLVVLTALRFSAGFGTAALRSAVDRGEDVVLCLIVDRELSDGVAGQLADVGFLGEKVMHDLQDAMVAEDRCRGLEYLEQLESEARALGLNVETETREGPFLDAVRELADKHGVARILASRLDRPHVSRLFFGSQVDRLARKCSQPVEIYDGTRLPEASGRACPEPPASPGTTAPTPCQCTVSRLRDPDRPNSGISAKCSISRRCTVLVRKQARRWP